VFDNINTEYRDARLYINESTAQLAVDVLSKDIETNTMTAEKYAYLSKAYIFLGDDEEALKYAKMAVLKDSEYVYGYVRLAFAYARLGQKENVRRFTDTAQSLNQFKNNYITSFLAVLYDYCSEPEMAQKQVEALKMKAENTADYFYYIGFVFSQERPEEALKYLRRAEQLDFEDKYNLWTNLAENYFLLDDFENTEKYVDKCQRICFTKRNLELKAECAKSRGEYEEAISYLRKKYKLDKPEDKISTLALLIYNYSELPNPNKTEKIINFALSKFEPDYPLYYVIASFYENNDNYENAISYYKLMEKFEENRSTTYASLSYCYSELEDYSPALIYAEKAVAANPEDSYAHYRKGRLLVKLKNYEDAIASFMHSIDYDKTDVDSFQWISYCYSMLKNYDKSLEFANRAILINKEDCYSYFRKAWAYQEMGRYQEAINFYQQCIERDDKYVDAYLNISYIYSKLKDNKQSLLYANKALLLNKDYAYAHYRKAWALQESGRMEEAIDGYSKAIELDPTDIYNYLGIACISLNNQENAAALLYANKAIFIDRNCGGAYYYKSLALSNLGKSKEAEQAYARALALGYNP